jgi:dihydroorotate dehydrogenase (NAD+) catalytic subunit
MSQPEGAGRPVAPSAEPTAGTRPTVSVDLAPRRPGGLRLAHRVLVAAGGAGYGTELIDAVGEALPAAIVTRSTTRAPRRGHPAPRMAPQAGGLLWSVGLQNPGLDAVLRRHGARWGSSDVPIIVSLCADTVEDITAMAQRLELVPEVAGIELNLACPDRGRGGLPIGCDVAASELATVAARAATDLPLIVKLTPVATDLREIARAVAAAGADAISAIGPLPALAIDAGRAGPTLGGAYGSLSGPALRSIGLRAVYEIAQVVAVPIIGSGGVARLADVLDHLAAGASAVSLATAALADPTLPARLARSLEEWCARRGIGDVRQLVGTALPRRRDRGSLRQGPWRL